MLQDTESLRASPKITTPELDKSSVHERAGQISEKERKEPSCRGADANPEGEIYAYSLIGICTAQARTDPVKQIIRPACWGYPEKYSDRNDLRKIKGGGG